MSTHYTEFMFMGHRFRASMYDYIERYGTEYGKFSEKFMMVPGRWHFDLEIMSRASRKEGEGLYEKVLRALGVRRGDVFNPHFNDLAAGKRQVRRGILKLAKQHPKRWGIISWDGVWHRASSS